MIDCDNQTEWMTLSIENEFQLIHLSMASLCPDTIGPLLKFEQTEWIIQSGTVTSIFFPGCYLPHHKPCMN